MAIDHERKGASGPDALVSLARRAMERAYAPYSGFRVGAALETEEGERYAGCNVENVSYPVSMCAERSALAAAVSAGARRFRRLAICSSGSRPAAPCGMCRQALAEFAPDLQVVSVTPGGRHRSWGLPELLPVPFSGEGTRRASGAGAAAP